MRLVDIFLEFIDKMIIFVGNNIFQHYCPVKVDKAFFEIIEIQPTTVLFKGATI